MPSVALDRWRYSGLSRLAELEAVHATFGPGPGRRWGTTQLNRSLFVALLAQFQRFCRDLHDEATAVHLSVAVPSQSQVLETLIRQGRKLDTHNPRASTLGHDFGRLGIALIKDVKAMGPRSVARLELLDRLVDYRNAVGHGDDDAIELLEARGRIRATKNSYLRYKRSLDCLAGTIDRAVSIGLRQVLSGPEPW